MTTQKTSDVCVCFYRCLRIFKQTNSYIPLTKFKEKKKGPKSFRFQSVTVRQENEGDKIERKTRIIILREREGPTDRQNLMQDPQIWWRSV